MESFDSYQAQLQAAGLQVDEVIDLSRYLAGSYANHVEGLRQHRASLVEAIGTEYVDYTIGAMERWVQAGQEGKLGWGLFVARK